MKEVNSRDKVQSSKTRNNNKPVEPKSHTQKPGRQITIGQRFSLNKYSAVHEKPNTPRSLSLGGYRRVEFPRLAGLSSGLGPHLMTPGTINSRLVQNIPSPTLAVPPTNNDWDSFFQPMFDEYFKPLSNVDHPVPEVPTLVPAALTSSPSSTTVDQDAPSTKPSYEETTLQWIIPSNLHHLNQSFDTLTKLTKKHPLENVIGDPSR
ncbi:hypothetical protein Tco_1105754 [Tanacetum coccineum]